MRSLAFWLKSTNTPSRSSFHQRLVAASGRPPLDLARDGLGSQPDLGEPPARRDAGIDVKAPRPRSFRPRDQAVVLQHLAGHQRDVDDPPPRDPGHRVQIDPQFVGVVEVAGEHRVRIEVDAAQVDRPRQPGGVMDDRFGGRGAGRVAQLGDVHPVRPFRGRPLLEYGLLGDALDEAFQNHRPAGHTAQRPVGDRQVITHQVELGVRAGTRVGGEDHFVRMGDGDLASGHFQ